MLFSEQQIDGLVSDFESRLRGGDIKKTVLPNTAEEYCHGTDMQDLETICNADKDSPLFNMSMNV